MSGALDSSIGIGTRPGQIAVSSDGVFVYAATNDRHSVQRYDVSTNSLDLLFTMPGSGQFFEGVRQLYAIPGQPSSVLIERGLVNFSPPAVATGVWTNGVELPQTVGTGLGVGGPDILAIDETGTRAVGYQNSVSSFSTWSMAIDGNGVHSIYSINNGPVSGFTIGHIGMAGNRLFDDHGNIYDINNNFAPIGNFATSGNFLVDASLDRIFSVVLTGGVNQINVYELGTLQQIGVIGGLASLGNVATSNLIRAGTGGLAFTTSNDKVVILSSQLVPEPSSLVLAAFAGAGLAAFAWRRRR